MHTDNTINYIEIPTRNISKTKQFFNQVFGWAFTDYGEDYTSFSGQGIDGGFFTSEFIVSTKNGSPLIVLYHQDLVSIQAKITQADGHIIEPIFSFPGGKRFHFVDPNGNEYAVWSE